MKAMIFAAGRGERMRPLTDEKPKPLLTVRGRPLILWHILNLSRAGITDIVINHAHLGHMIEEALGDGSRYGVKINYSAEGTALETAGGVAKARHLLGNSPFLAVSADIYCPHFNFTQATEALEDKDVWGKPYALDKRDMAWLYLVKNPPHHPEGDFALNSFSISNEGEPRFTYSGIGVFRPEMFDSVSAGEIVRISTLIREYAARGQIGGEVIRDEWTDVGTVERLEQLNKPLIKK